MNIVSVETSTLYPGGIRARSVVERDERGDLVRVVAVDYLLPAGHTVEQVARSYAVLYDVELGEVAA